MTFAIDCQPSYIRLRGSAGHHLSPGWQWNMAQPIVLQKHPQPREVCRTCPCVPWETLQCFIPWIICPRGLGQVTAIKATRELILGMALETGLQHCQPGNGEQAPCFWKDHCILDEKKKIAFLNRTVYFYSKLLFVNTMFCTLGVAVPSVHVSFRQRKETESDCLLGCSYSPTVLAKFPS